MGWSDCGRKTNAQLFYGRKIGRKQAGRCGRYEVRTALYAQRLEKTWKRLFRLKFEREPSEEELWAVLRTGEIAKNVLIWEREPLKESKLPKRAHIHRGRGGKRITKILAQSVRESKDKVEAEKRAELIKEEVVRLKFAEDTRLLKIRQSSEVPRNILVKLAYNKVEASTIHLLFGVDANRVSILSNAFSIKGIKDGQERQEGQEGQENQGDEQSV